MTTEFWIISAPCETSRHHTFDSLNNLTSSKNQNLSTNYRFNIPSDLKVGTLDQLVGLSDDLAKLDAITEGITKKLASYMLEILEDNHERVSENIMVKNMTPDQYLMKFNWEGAKYPTKQSLKTIADIISKNMNQIDADLKTKAALYNSTKTNLQTLERKSTGSLLTRNLGDIVKKEFFILGSEYLKTVLVVVPKALYKEWYIKYENLAEMIVPRSSVMIYEDQEQGLFTVTLFTRDLDSFKYKAKENKFVVRDFDYDEKKLTGDKNEIAKLETDKRKLYALLVRWLKVNFGEAFSAWLHLKALRVFVESVLRYGLPVNFQAMVVQPHKKSTRRLREVLNQHYAHLDTSLAQGPMDDIPGLNLAQSEYYPYVYFKINLDFLPVLKH